MDAPHLVTSTLELSPGQSHNLDTDDNETYVICGHIFPNVVMPHLTVYS